MDSATSSLIGATVGALAAIGGSLLAHNLQARREHKNWLRSKKEEAYLNSLRCLLQIMHERSFLFTEGERPLKETKDWLNHFSEAQIWLNSLTVYAAENRRAMIVKLAEKLNRSAMYLLGPMMLKEATGEMRDELAQLLAAKSTNIFDDVRSIYQEILTCAREDIGINIP